jgi:Transcriptional regulator, AbiEi antitoxin
MCWRAHDQWATLSRMAYTLPENLDRLAQFQSGVLSAQQAMAGGLTRGMIRARVRSGRWRKLQYGVYATFSGVPNREAVLWAAVLRAGSGAVLSHYTAAELYELTDWPSSAIHLTIPEQRRVTALPGIKIHIANRAELAAHPTLLPPRTRLEETVLDLAGAARTADEACGWITRGVGRGLTTQERLRRALGQRARVRFRAEITEVLSDEWAGVNSPLEYRYVKWVELPHCLPRSTRQAAATRAGRREYRDVLYDGYGLIVELDGRAAHPGDTRWSDIQRDNAALASGLVTLRYGWDDLRMRPCLVADQVYRALARSGPVTARPCSPACPVTRTSL